MKPLCIYHGNCDDGFGAAWVVRRFFGDGNVDFYPGVYQQAPPDVSDRDVLMVDFSYKRPMLEEMLASCRSLLVLDHHKTAAEDLTFLPATWPTYVEHVVAPTHKGHALFDMNRSGAGIAWDFFFPTQKRPPFINYLEDRDLWRKQLPHGDEFTIALRSYSQDFAIWDKLIDSDVERLISEGYSLQRYYRLRVEELKRSAYPASLAGVTCWIGNAPYFAASEVAGELCDRGEPFGACYFEASHSRFQYSLRSRDEFDVSAIAKQFGGGGHRNAAGFSADKPVHIPLVANNGT